MNAASPSSGCGSCSGCKRTSTWLKKMVPLLLIELGSFTESDDTRDNTPCRRAGDEFKCFRTCVGSGLNSSFPSVRSTPSSSPLTPLLSVVVVSLLSLSLSYSPTSSSLSPTRTLPRPWSRPTTPPSSPAHSAWPAAPPLPSTPLNGLPLCTNTPRLDTRRGSTPPCAFTVLRRGDRTWFCFRSSTRALKEPPPAAKASPSLPVKTACKTGAVDLRWYSSSAAVSVVDVDDCRGIEGLRSSLLPCARAGDCACVRDCVKMVGVTRIPQLDMLHKCLFP